MSPQASIVQSAAQPLIDGCGRRMDHLRLSLTDRCNLACRYCSAGRRLDCRAIAPDFALAVVRWLSTRHGVSHVRLTGGEPLLYPQLLPLVGGLAALPGLEEITLTTNGQALAVKAGPLREAGLSRVNISLDTLDPTRSTQLTRGGELAHTLVGIEAAVRAGLAPVRINVVVQRGFNDDELCHLAEWGCSRGCTVRFLEMMPIGQMVDELDRHLVPAAEILERLSRRFSLSPVASPPGQPATDYAAVSRDGACSGVIGVIASTTRPFCSRCRRLRITAGGEILSCLFDTGGSSLAAAWDGRTLDEQAADRILQAAVMAKPEMGRRTQQRSMIGIGG